MDDRPYLPDISVKPTFVGSLRGLMVKGYDADLFLIAQEMFREQASGHFINQANPDEMGYWMAMARAKEGDDGR